MKRLLIGLLAIGGYSSFASVELNGPLDGRMFTKEVEDNKSYYDTLGEMFQEGSKPEPAKILGVMWSGRCFKKNSPYKPQNGAYHFKAKKTQDVGPIGDRFVSYEASSIYSANNGPSYFDDKDISIFAYANAKYKRVFNYEDSVAIKSGNDLSRLRVSGKYLVEELAETKNNVGSLDEKYEAWIRCYYFIPNYDR